MPKKLTEMQSKVLQVLQKYGPMTDEQLSRRMAKYPGSTVRTRRAELVSMHKVREYAEKKNARGRFVSVWSARR